MSDTQELDVSASHGSILVRVHNLVATFPARGCTPPARRRHRQLVMAEVPKEFTAEHIEANSSLENQLYTKQLRTPFPRKSFEEQGFVFAPSPNDDESEFSFPSVIVVYYFHPRKPSAV